MTSKRSLRSWDRYFLGVADAVAKKSKDPASKVGAVIVSNRLIIATGFNGLARTVTDDQEILKEKFEKLDWIIHAEHNAVLNAARVGVGVRNASVYVNKFPCFSCLQCMVQVGIRRIYTADDAYWKNDPLDSDHSGKRHIIAAAGLEVVAPNHPDFRDSLPRLKPGVRKSAVVASAGPAPSALTPDQGAGQLLADERK